MSPPFFRRPFQPREPKHRCNGKIRAREVRVIDENKQQLGIMPLNDALRLAQTKGLDLIEISPTAMPPVCRIFEYGKFLYQESKRTKDAKTNNAGKMKEIQLSAVIDPHDFGVKLNQGIQFLCSDMKIHVKLRFRGRQQAHKEIGFKIMNDYAKQVQAYGVADSPPKAQGERDISVTISPLPRNKRAKNPREIEEAPSDQSKKPASQKTSEPSQETNNTPLGNKETV